MAAQKVKTYLEKHKIGALFEDLMAKVIKDMPSEPLAYLIDVLKQMYKKKHPEKIRPPSPQIQSNDFGLAGVPAPKRSQKDPHLILPGGGKTVSNTWNTHDIDRLKSNRVSFDESKRREYEKPWQSGAKYSMLKEDHELRQSRKNVINQERPRWNQDTKVPAHGFDEWRKYNEGTKGAHGDTDNNKKREKKAYYVGVKSWADTTADRNMTTHYENGLLRQPVARPLDNYRCDDDLDLRNTIRRKTVSFEDLSTTTSDTESSISSVKPTKQSAKEQATERKKQLQDLLAGVGPIENTLETKIEERDSSDEAPEIYESEDELHDEGVTKSGSRGVRFPKKHKHSSFPADDIKVKICGRCARFMTGEEASTVVPDHKSEAGTFVWNRKSYTDVTSEADYDFESVSQIGKSKKLPAWPVITDSEADTETPRPRERKSQRGTSALPSKGYMMQRHDSYPTVRSADEASTRSRDRKDHEDMFSGDIRSYQKHRAKKAGYLTDTETEIGARSALSDRSTFRLHGGRGWSMKSIGTDSEADAEDSDPAAGVLNRRAHRSTKSILR